MSLPKCIQRVIDDGITSAKVIQSIGDEHIKVLGSSLIGSGIMCNCDLMFLKAGEAGLFLEIREGKDGRLVLELKS